MCKKSELSYLQDEIREEYIDYSCCELHDEINRLRQKEQDDETRLRVYVLTELLRDANVEHDSFD